jgi:hypothetical protein
VADPGVRAIVLTGAGRAFCAAPTSDDPAGRLDPNGASIAENTDVETAGRGRKRLC